MKPRSIRDAINEAVLEFCPGMYPIGGKTDCCRDPLGCKKWVCADQFLAALKILRDRPPDDLLATIMMQQGLMHDEARALWQRQMDVLLGCSGPCGDNASAE